MAATPGLDVSPSLLTQNDRRGAAQKLREKGWSYRRIAQDLGVPYILVSKWLNDEPNQATAPARAGHAPRVARTPVEPAGTEQDDPAEEIETLKLQYGALERYMQPMMEALERSRLLDADGTDARTPAAMEQRIASLEAAVASLQDQLRAMAAGTAPIQAVPVPAGGKRTGDDSVAVEDPFGATDPFADTPDPFADTAPSTSSMPFPAADENPFDEPALLLVPVPDPVVDTPDPFASPAEPPVPAAADPFAAADIDPFAAQPGPATADPFAAADADPFAPSAVPPAPAAVDPFADAPDPFALAEPPVPVAADPFAAADADPFAPSAAPSDPATTDPFADAPDPFAPAQPSDPAPADPFASADTDPFAPAADPDPFAAPSAEPDPEPAAPPPKSLGARLKFWKR